MAPMHLRQLDTVEQLRAECAAWDDLWQRSETTIPTARAELVALWLEQFAPRGTFRALVVEDSATGRWLAALPLVRRRTCRVIPCAGVTANYWSPNGNLLLDSGVDAEPVLDLMVGAMERLGWPLFWFDLVPIDQLGWQAMVRVGRRRGLHMDVHPRWDVGRVAIDGDVAAYFASRSKNLRRTLRKHARRLEETAPLECRLEKDFSADDVESGLREIFTIEDRSWKGEAGGSVLRHPTIFEFYFRQACRLAEWGSLRLARLRHGDRTIAFDLGWLGHDVYHSYKVGYDPDYAAYGPGHLLRERLIHALAGQGDARAIDFQGPQTDALAAWSTDSYPIARLVIAGRRASGRVLWTGYRATTKIVRSWRRIW